MMITITYLFFCLETDPRTTKSFETSSGISLYTWYYILLCLYPTIYNIDIANKVVLISIVIPTFNEENIHHTLTELSRQTVFGKYDTEIIIADFDPAGTMTTYNSLGKFRDFFPHLTKYHTFIPVDRKGIAYARNQGIIASSGSIIV